VTGDDLVGVIAKKSLIDPGGRTVCGRGSDRALLSAFKFTIGRRLPRGRKTRMSAVRGGRNAFTWALL